jgi:hypothetical protein
VGASTRRDDPSVDQGPENLGEIILRDVLDLGDVFERQSLVTSGTRKPLDEFT